MVRTACFGLLAAMLAGCGRGVPAPGSDEYNEAVSAFFSGVAAMEVGEDRRAEAKLSYVAELVPTEPAAWANLALMASRRGEAATAAAYLEEARRLNAEGSYVLRLSGLIALREGRIGEGQAFLRQAMARPGADLHAAYALWESLEEGSPDADALLPSMLRAAPDNLVLLVAVLRSQLAGGQVTDSVRAAVAERSALLSAEAAAQLNAAFVALEAGDAQGGVMQLSFLRNLLLSDPVYRQHLAALRAPVEVIAHPLTELRRMTMPQAAPAPRDEALSFVLEPFANTGPDPQGWVSAIALGNEGLPALFYADGSMLATLRSERWAFPGTPGSHAVTGIDYNADFRTDLALAGPEGLRMLVQDSTETFHDVTGTLGLQDQILSNNYAGVWSADLDLEGDLDLVLAAGGLHTLRNNGDGTFEPIDFFGIAPAPKNFIWADLDSDGDPDAAWVDDEGALHVYSNERQGRFVRRDAPEEIRHALDLAVTDSNSDGAIDLIILGSGGEIWRLTDRHGWNAETIASGAEGFERILVADLDNNGGQDIVVTRAGASRVWLQDADFAFKATGAVTPLTTFAVASVVNVGQLDLVGLDSLGSPARAQILSPEGYHWKQVRPRAARAVGDQRINTFGIGGEIELRSGVLYQKQPITQPTIHFGLGHRLLGDVARITWPNGSVQAEFDLQSDRVISAQQRLTASCPWLFTNDGEEVTFVTDFIWRSPLGLRINAQETAGIMTTEDWVKIRGDQLAAINGSYDVRITAELWETHFFDYISLMAVDHAEGTEIFVDERFAFPPPALTVHVTGLRRPVTAVVTDTGQNVSDLAGERDGRYVDFFGRGTYQGITRDHFLEIDLGDAVPNASWLVASGWIRPTDSSINVAISQGKHAPPKPLRLEVLKSDGTWTTVHANLGFPSGKAKTVLIDLEGLFARTGPRRVRLHTNLEIYWDALHWAAKMPASAAAITHLDPLGAELRYRGYSLVTEADRSSPELPHYGIITGTVPVWRDLIGYYTRFGAVDELLEVVDDRYVIMNAGDELALRFAEAPPLADGLRRDFVLIGDGWVKDGNLNTTAGKYVRPLPAHDTPDYEAVPGALQDEPVFQRHAWDWQRYHTRYVVPEHYSRGIRLR